MGKTLAEEAAEFKSKKKTPNSASDKVALRFYMGNIIGGLVSGNQSASPDRLIEGAFNLAKELLKFEKENF